VPDEFPENLFPLAQDRAALYAKHVARGLARMRDRRVVIAGVVRNSIEVLPHTIERIESLAKLFGDYRVVFYENDSVDGTVELLTAWTSNNPRVTACCDLLGTPAGPKVRSKTRGDQMADCRNWYHHYIANWLADFDNVIVLDMDLQGGWSNDGIANTFGWDDWDFVGSNGLILQRARWKFNTWLQFDAWAFRRFGSFEPIRCREVNDYTWRRGEPMQSVYSCFGGLGVYRMPAFLAGRYGGGDCEHVQLHRGMRAAGFDRIFLNPSQLVFYGRKVRSLEQVVRLYNRVRYSRTDVLLPAY
jgi:hypothetical protein